MTETINQNFFQTYDLGCAGALVSAGYHLKNLDKSQPRKAQFLFVKEESIEQSVEDYFSGNFQVDALAFFNALKNLKNRIYSS